jgi:hypothetical protein
MNATNMLMFFKSTDCLNIFPQNNPSRFFVKIPELIQFNKNQSIHVIDLIVPEFVHNGNMKTIYLMTNIVSEVFVGYKKIPVLQRYFVQLEENEQNQFGFQLDTQIVPSNLKDITTDVIEIAILDGETLQHAECVDGVTYCAFKIE